MRNCFEEDVESKTYLSCNTLIWVATNNIISCALSHNLISLFWRWFGRSCWPRKMCRQHCRLHVMFPLQSGDSTHYWVSIQHYTFCWFSCQILDWFIGKLLNVYFIWSYKSNLKTQYHSDHATLQSKIWQMHISIQFQYPWHKHAILKIWDYIQAVIL